MNPEQAARLQARYARRAGPIGLTVEELDFGHFPAKNGFPGIPVKAWIRFTACAELVDGAGYARDSWWETRRTAAVGSGDLVSVEYWRVQVRLGTNSALRTFTLRRNPLSARWLLETISDAGHAPRP